MRSTEVIATVLGPRLHAARRAARALAESVVVARWLLAVGAVERDEIEIRLLRLEERLARIEAGWETASRGDCS